MSRFRRQEGITLIEITVILAVITVLAGMLVPAIFSFLSDANRVLADDTVKKLASSLLTFYRETGFFPKTFDTVNGVPGYQVVDLLVSAGKIPRAPTGPVRSRSGSLVNVGVSGWLSGSYDLLDNHLIRNVPGYRKKGGPNPIGWNGPYYADDGIPADPWGNRYMVNIGFMDDSPGILDASGRIKIAVMVVCAGPNAIIETPFIQPRTMVDMETTSLHSYSNPTIQLSMLRLAIRQPISIPQNIIG